MQIRAKSLLKCSRRLKSINALKELQNSKVLTPSQKAGSIRILAGDIVRTRKSVARMRTVAAQLDSIELQIREQHSVRKIQDSMKNATGIMQTVNSLVRIPQHSAVMRQLSKELMKAGIIQEMTDDMIPEAELEDLDEGTEAEIAQVLSECLGPQKVANEPEPEPEPAQKLPEAPVEPLAKPAETENPQGRLNALKTSS